MRLLPATGRETAPAAVVGADHAARSGGPTPPSRSEPLLTSDTARARDDALVPGAGAERIASGGTAAEECDAERGRTGRPPPAPGGPSG